MESVVIGRIEDKIEKYVNNSDNTKEKGTLFCKWILKYLFEQSDSEIGDMCEIDGKSDNSIDAFFEEDKIFRIIQTKYNTSHNWAGVAKFIADMKRIIEFSNKYVGDNNLVPEVCNKIEQYLEEDKHIEIYYITNSNFTKEEREKIEFELDKFGREFDCKFNKVTLHILDIEGIKDFIDMSLDIIPKKYRNATSKLILKNYFISNITYVAEVELRDFAEFVMKNKEYLFYSNIRNYLKSTPVNKGIVKTFKEKPKDFWYFNNGITIVCDDFKPESEKVLEIFMPQIVNGCQTANTILNEYRKISTNQKKQKQGTILVKIIKDKNKKDEITQYTNRQNSVSGKDFFALDIFQKKMVKEFENLGYFYEIQNKSSIARKVSEMEKYKGMNEFRYLFSHKFNNILQVKLVVQAFASAMYFMPGTATSRSGELMVYGEKWSKIFNDKTPEKPLNWLYPFAVMTYAKNNLEYNNKSSVLYKKYSLMFYVACYFRCLVHIFKEIELIGRSENINPLEIEIENYTKIFKNSDVNKEILNFVDGVIKRFMRDKSITEAIKKKYDNLDIANFMKSEVETNETIRTTLDEFIIEELHDNRELLSTIKKIY